MTMDEDRDGFAAEFVLGTLDADERAQADALVLVDPDFAAKVRRWERRLGELNVLVAPVEPPAPVWDRIKAGLESAGQVEQLHLPELPKPPERIASPSAEIVDLTQRMRRWRGLTVITGTLAACIVGLMLTREYRPDVLPANWRPTPQVVERVVEKPVEVVKEVVREVPAPQPAQFVAVLQRDDVSPQFLLTFDLNKRTVTVRKVAAQDHAGKSYELWMVSDQTGGRPQSLGVISGDEYTVRNTIASYDPATIPSATFAVSLEPEGGSPTGQPTQPLYHAKLVQTAPSQNP